MSESRKAGCQSMAKSKELTCEACKKTFHAKMDHGKWPKFCCRDCFLSNCIRPKKKRCKQCGNEFLARSRGGSSSDDGRNIFCSKGCYSKSQRTGDERPCAQCGAKFYPKNISNQNKCCSRGCAQKYFIRENNPTYKGGVSHQADGQRWRLNPRDGYVGKYMQEHRMAAEKYIGRPLMRHEPILHINRDKSDNRTDNLFLCTSRSEASQRVNGSLPWPQASNLSKFKQVAG